MKVRADFVSNSSSTSFIVSTQDLDVSKLDTKFFKLIGRCESLCFFANDSEFSKELLEEVKKYFGSNVDIEDDVVSLDLDGVKLYDKKTMDVVKKLLVETNNIDCSYGCDDCGEYVAEATQVCTALELLYDIVPEGDDHFDYTSIKNLGVEL